MTVSVLALTRYDRMGASSRVRFLQYIPYLERQGVKVAVQPLFGRDYLMRLYRDGGRAPLEVGAAMANRLWRMLNHGDEQIVWLQREILPFLPFAVEEALLKGRKLVVDYDDAHHLYYKDLKLAPARKIYGDKIEQLMRRADAVVVGNRTLAEHARAAGAKNIHLIPSAVDVSRFKTQQAGSNAFTVGWIGTPVTAAQTLHLVQEPLRKFMAETGARCVLMGAGKDQFPEITAERLPWSEAGEAAFFEQISVGLCPLEDNDWSRGKSGYKIIQYMAAGKPALVSPVGIAAELVEHGKTGFHCRNEQDWHTYLIQLYRDTALREAMGTRAQVEAETRYDTALAAAQMARIFEACTRG